MRNIVLVNIGVWLLLLLIFTTVELPGNTLLWQSIQNSGHGIVMCFAAFFGISSIALKLPLHRRKSFIFIPAALLVLSALIEVIQYITGRGASLEDLALDVTGITAGACLSAAVCFDSKFEVKAIFLIFGVLLLLFCVRTPIFYFVERAMTPKLPVLASFDNFAAGVTIHSNGAEFSIGKHEDIWPESSANSMRVTYAAGKEWPGVTIPEPATNWSNYEYLSMDVFNAGIGDIELHVRVDYLPPEGTEKAYMVAQRIVPAGHSSVELSFEELVMVTIGGGEASFTDVGGVVLFLFQQTTDVTLYFDNLVLR